MSSPRWICWPNPDRVCLSGGCVHCRPADPAYPSWWHHEKTWAELARYAESKGWPVTEIEMDV